jgi:hypothetical protein
VAMSSTKMSLRVTDKPVNVGSYQGPQPMDIGAFDNGKGGKGAAASAVCFNCGKTGHFKKDCWQAPGSGGSGGVGKGKQSGGGSGKGGGSDRSNIQCWRCFQYGHMGKDCPQSGGSKGKGKGGKGKGKGKGKKGKSKGKGKQHFSSIESDYDAEWPDPGAWKSDWEEEVDADYVAWEQWNSGQEPEQELSNFDVGEVWGGRHLGSFVNTPKHPESWATKSKSGGTWIKVNWDSGAAVSAFPTALFEDHLLTEVGSFVVASGASIPNYGGAELEGYDENGNIRALQGSITSVHKPLGSASAMAKRHDCILWEDGGTLIPRDSPIAVGLRKEYWRLEALHGSQGNLELHREGPLYNFYLQVLKDPTPKVNDSISHLGTPGKKVSFQGPGDSSQ